MHLFYRGSAIEQTWQVCSAALGEMYRSASKSSSLMWIQSTLIIKRPWDKDDSFTSVINLPKIIEHSWKS